MIRPPGTPRIVSSARRTSSAVPRQTAEGLTRSALSRATRRVISRSGSATEGKPAAKITCRGPESPKMRPCSRAIAVRSTAPMKVLAWAPSRADSSNTTTFPARADSTI
ncbi:hypothetical protein Kisp02_25190 [Kineosporia sp. NBRC 101731]|nr:hypothetical protein [Kineosporia sp. NBRC 101731]GLY29154.1 hypothetical protein Kisp02_25190 [Kineosporia sp. NBRC 101731]